MNKKLLALAVAGALVAPAAAMADATVYGKVHLALDYVGGDVDETAPTDTYDYGLQVVSNSSRLGFKGSDDLGGGLTAVWQYEVGFDVVEKNAINADRNSYLGLKGGFGTFLVGRIDTPLKNISRKYELFPEYVGDSRETLDDVVGTSAGWDLRTDNTIAYVLPKMGAISGTLAYVADHNKAGTSSTGKDDSSFDAYSVAFGFDGGPFTVDLGYEVHNINQDMIATPGNGIDTDSESAFRVGAGFKTGALKLVALYQMAMDEGFIDGNDRTSYGLGASFDLSGGNVVKAQYYVADSSDEVAVDNGASTYALAFDHKFSKATTAYVAYAATDNDDGSDASPWGTDGGRGDAVPCELGGSCNAFSVGMITNF